ncbi:MAG: DNA gyrase inhibitor YacG, partial [Hyphomicrobium sp.]|nr:DNA gyrase inhibitor YacG [Hyphomicrobium sp.]
MSASRSASKPLRCPICGKEAVEAYRPFCSKRCADIDLAKWFSGS